MVALRSGPLFSWPAAWPDVDADVAACSVAVINSLGNAGGLVGPSLVGYFSRIEGEEEATGHKHALAVLGSCAVMASVLTMSFRASRASPGLLLRLPASWRFVQSFRRGRSLRA